MAVDFARQLVARWPQPEAAHVRLLQQAGIRAIVCDSPDAAFTSAAVSAGIAIAAESELSAAGAVTRGLWPGIRRPGRQLNWENNLVASASAEPWIDSNCYLTPLERALSPAPPRSPVIAFEAGPKAGLPADRSVPFATLELALAEARLQGGNYILSVDPRYRQALLAGEAQARAAWESLARTAAWLDEHAGFWGREVPGAITTLVEPGAASAEIANLLYRRNGSPRLVNAASLGAPDPAHILVLVAVGLKTVPEAVWKHAEAGSTVVIDNPALVRPSWRRLRPAADRDFYSAGRGQVLVYKKRIAEPSEFALDVIDVVGHRRRTARLWNARSAVAFATAGPRPGEALLNIINYGARQREDEVQARIHGHFKTATLLRPEAPAVTLKTSPRGLATEVFLPTLQNVAVIHFRA